MNNLRFKALATASVLAMGVALIQAPALAQQTSRYQAWQPEQVGVTRDLVKELRALVEEAERARAADPRFLDDLKSLANRYEQAANAATTAPGAAQPQPPSAAAIMTDDFRDGDHVNGTLWTVQRGKFWVESAVGLRTVVKPSWGPPESGASSSGSTGTKTATDLLGGIVDQYLRAGQKPATQNADTAEIRTAASIPNAFQSRIEITSREKAGELRFGAFQGNDAANGYQLSYVPGVRPGLRLFRISPRGDSVLAAHDATLDLEDGRLHVIELARSRVGEISVSVDGKRLIRVTDNSLRDPFNGLALINYGGDYALRSAAVARAP